MNFLEASIAKLVQHLSAALALACALFCFFGLTALSASDAFPRSPLPTAHANGAGDENWSSEFGSPPGVLGEVRTMTRGADGTLYVGGEFVWAGNTRVNHIARWDGTTWSALGVGVDFVVSGLAVGAGQDVYASGFTLDFRDLLYVMHWDGSRWTPLGGVDNGKFDSLPWSMVFFQNELYVAGGFTRVGTVAVNSIARWDGNLWQPVGEGTKPVSVLYANHKRLLVGTREGSISVWDGKTWGTPKRFESIQQIRPIRAIATHGKTMVVAGDDFENQYLEVIVRWNGKRWTKLDKPMEGLVSTLAFLKGVLYVGGEFTQVGNLTVNGLVRWRTDHWENVPRLRNFSNEPLVTSFVTSHHTLIVGGSFAEAGKVVVSSITQLDPQGDVWTALGQTHNASPNGTVKALAKTADGIYAAGLFDHVGDTLVNNIARWDGQQWHSVGSGLNGNVLALATQGNLVFAGGDFSQAGDIPVANIAKWDGRRWSTLGDAQRGTFGYVNAILADHSKLYVGTAYGLSIFDFASATWKNYPEYGTVTAFANWKGRIYIAGYHLNTPIGTTTVLGYWDPSKQTLIGILSGDQIPHFMPNALAATDDYLYAGGSDHLDGIWHLVRWDGNTFSDVGGGVDYEVTALEAANGILYVGGDFATAGGETVNSVAAWNGSTWNALGLGVRATDKLYPSEFYTVRALLADGGNLYVGGRFDQAGDKLSYRIARWKKP